jgi:glycerol dehydrogenase
MSKPKVLITPNRFVIGAGVMDQIGEYIKRIGDRVLLLGGKTALSLTRDRIKKSLGEHKVEIVGEDDAIKMCTHKTINRLVGLGTKVKANAVIGVGGGVSADTCKAVAHKLGARIITVPTIATSNADCSALSVVYTEAHEFEEYLLYPKNPDVVIVDSKIIAQGPPGSISKGMGDALACRFEAEACRASESETLAGGLSTSAGMAFTDLCFDYLMKYGLAAKLATDKGLLTPAVENIIEAIKLLSGVGFESTGLAAAHAMHNGLTTIPEVYKNKDHGEIVAFCTITQTILENRDIDETLDLIDWCVKVGLPVTLSELGNISDTDLKKASEKACDPADTMHCMPFTVTPDMAVDAFLMADILGSRYKEEVE